MVKADLFMQMEMSMRAIEKTIRLKAMGYLFMQMTPDMKATDLMINSTVLAQRHDLIYLNMKVSTSTERNTVKASLDGLIRAHSKAISTKGISMALGLIYGQISASM